MEVSDIIRMVISGLVGGIVAPFIMSIWNILSPPKETSYSEKYDYDELLKRNSGINGIASVLSIVGILLVVPLYVFIVPHNNPWPVGLGFGLMVILPSAYITVVTMVDGKQRLFEFFRFYELHYKVNKKSVMIVYVIVSSVGILSAYQLVFNYM